MNENLSDSQIRQVLLNACAKYTQLQNEHIMIPWLSEGNRYKKEQKVSQFDLDCTLHEFYLNIDNLLTNFY